MDTVEGLLSQIEDALSRADYDYLDLLLDALDEEELIAWVFAVGKPVAEKVAAEKADAKIKAWRSEEELKKYIRQQISVVNSSDQGFEILKKVIAEGSIDEMDLRGVLDELASRIQLRTCKNSIRDNLRRVSERYLESFLIVKASPEDPSEKGVEERQNPRSFMPGGLSNNSAVRKSGHLLSEILVGNVSDKVCINTSLLKSGMRSFFRCATIEAMLEERTFVDFKNVYVAKINAVARDAKQERRQSKLWVKFIHFISNFLKTKGGGGASSHQVAAIGGWRNISIRLNDADKLLKQLECTIGAYESVLIELDDMFSPTHADRRFEEFFRGAYGGVSDRLGTWARRITSGVYGFLLAGLAGVMLTISLSSLLPTEKWFWLLVSFALAIGWLVWYSTRLCERVRLHKIKRNFSRYDPDESSSSIFVSLDDGRVPESWKVDPWTSASKNSGLNKGLLVAGLFSAFIFVGSFLWLMCRDPKSPDASYELVGSMGGMSCTLETGVVWWAGPGDYIVQKENGTFSTVKHAAIQSVRKAPAGASLRSCDEETSVAPSTTPSVTLTDARSSVRSVLIPFPGEVNGCTSDEMLKQTKMTFSSNGEHAVDGLLRSLSNCASEPREARAVIDVLGYASEKGFDCRNSDSDKLNLDLAELRRTAVLERLAVKDESGLWRPHRDSFEIDNPQEKRWGESVARMKANRLFHPHVDAASRYVEVKIVHGGSCLSER